MKIVTSFLLLTLLAGATATANNVQIGNLELKAHDKAAGTRTISLNVSWENSWRTSTPSTELNYDAVWIFAKYRIISNTNGPWHHVTLKATGTTLITAGTSASADASVTVPTDKKGAFVYRTGDGFGNMNLSLDLLWDYKTDGLFDTQNVAICVYGIEMVYIPEGSFFVGDGSLGMSLGSTGHFVQGTTTSTPYKITSEEAININNSDTSSLWCTTPTAPLSGMGAEGTLPKEFPKGFKAFYIMKYPITQGQYCEFLNKLQQSQQINKGLGIRSAGAFYMNNSSPTYRNALRLAFSPEQTAIPRTYDVDLNNNGIGNEDSDGLNIPITIITFSDLKAYLDWTALRPITELEYEKACRGPLQPVPAEKAWGTANAYQAVLINNPGKETEVPNVGSNSSHSNNYKVQGPLRVGSFADVNSTSAAGPTREMSGASYYGVMELSSNVSTFVVDVANGRTFDGSDGDGAIELNGNSDNTGWPAVGGNRGGNWLNSVFMMNVSDRYVATNSTEYSRWASVGGRGARNAN